MRTPALKFCTLVVAIAVMIASNPQHPLAQATAPASPVSAPTTSGKASTYAAESIVIEHSDSVYTYAADGTGTHEQTLVVRVQSEAAVHSLGVIAVPYAANSQRVEFLYARVRHPDGTIVETQPSDALDVPDAVTREAPFYSDLKEKQLPIRSLRVGDTLEWKARVTTTKPEAPGEFWGQESFVDDAVALAETIELRVPATVSVNVWSPTSKPTESTADGMQVYRWASSQLKPTAGKEAEAEAETKKKAVWTADQELDADQDKLPAIAWTTFKSWADVGTWYQSLEADRVSPNSEVKAKVAELIAGKTTDEEKIRALYAYVSTQIRYIGVAFGIGRYQPHTAAEILSNQYGDCKDKHTLLAAMLSAAGIPSDAVLIGAGIRFNPAVPSPAAFNHLITHLIVSGQPVWLDTTAEIAPYRMLVPIIRDKQALVVPVTAAAHLDRTPADVPFASFQTMDADGSLDKNGTSHSRLTLTARGDTELILRVAFHQTAPAQYEELVQRLVHGIGYAGTTSNADVSRPEDTAQPFKISFDYEREKAGDWDNYKIIPQVAPVSLPRFGDADPLVRNLDLGAPHVETSHSAMKIPDGWTAVLPEAAHYKCSYATYDETYRFEKGAVYAERRIEVLKQKVPSADLNTYKKWANDADLGDEMYIQLVRHDADAGTGAGTTPGAAAGASTSSNPNTEAQNLIQQAYEDIQKLDLYNAKDLLDQARKLNPDHEYLWSTTGAMHFRNGEMTKALADYKQELALHPAAFQRMYPVIIQLQLVMDQRKDAMDSLRAWCKADPVDPAPVAQLLNMLIADGDAKTAVAEGEAAFTRLPADGHNEYARIALGQAYLAAGEKQKGQAALETVLKNSQDAGTLNDAAYELADASLDLPLAESSTRDALDKLAQESNSWTLDENPQVLVSKTRLIIATWDTLGWIYFREGKLDDALSYIQAGWISMPSLETGKHLGDILVSKGDKSGALTTYELAITTQPGYNALGVRTEPSEKQKQLQALADALLRSGVKSTAPIPANKLLELRTVHLGAADGRNGNAEYRVLLKDGRAIKVEPTGTKSIPGADAMISRAVFTHYFPTGIPTALVRIAYVNCHAKVCELLFEP
jgi:tetratricopeptide (TPR) repeat protein